MRHRTTAQADHDIDVESTGEALDRHLSGALDATERPEVRFHLRQGLQLLKALDERQE